MKESIVVFMPRSTNKNLFATRQPYSGTTYEGLRSTLWQRGCKNLSAFTSIIRPSSSYHPCRRKVPRHCGKMPGVCYTCRRELYGVQVRLLLAHLVRLFPLQMRLRAFACPRPQPTTTRAWLPHHCCVALSLRSHASKTHFNTPQN